MSKNYPVCEAMVRIALLDALYIAKGYRAISSNIDPVGTVYNPNSKNNLKSKKPQKA